MVVHSDEDHSSERVETANIRLDMHKVDYIKPYVSDVVIIITTMQGARDHS